MTRDRKSQDDVVDARSSQTPETQSGEPQQGEITGGPVNGELSADQLLAELEACRKEAGETFSRYQRLAADFENFKRRTRQDMVERTQYANEELLRKLLPLLDNFRRAIEHAPANVDQRWFDGIKLVARQFEATLEAQGLSLIPAVGEKFDPSQHEAIGSQETDDHEEGTIVEEMQPGYRLHEKVLRPTLVKVAQPRALNK
jgi:molecular chaperone GrpE